MKAYYYVCASHVIYMIILFVYFNSFFLEPACKKSCQPIADKLTDIQATKSTAEPPQNPMVPT